MDGYEPRAYGEAMADVYDEWYADTAEVDAAVRAVTALAHGGAVLELGVGTGRLALPLAAAGLAVTGIDVSPAMIERLRAKPGAERVDAIVGDMADDLPTGPYGLVLAAFSTFFALPSAEAQLRCFAAVASRLTADGCFVVEAFVPADELAGRGSKVELRSMSVDRVVLSITRHDAAEQRAEGQFVELGEVTGVSLRPWSLRYAPPAELDAMAERAGLSLCDRWASWEATPFGADSSHHVSVYRRPRPGTA